MMKGDCPVAVVVVSPRLDAQITRYAQLSASSGDRPSAKPEIGARFSATTLVQMLGASMRLPVSKGSSHSGRRHLHLSVAGQRGLRRGLLRKLAGHRSLADPHENRGHDPVLRSASNCSRRIGGSSLGVRAQGPSPTDVERSDVRRVTGRGNMTLEAPRRYGDIQWLDRFSRAEDPHPWGETIGGMFNLSEIGQSRATAQGNRGRG